MVWKVGTGDPYVLLASLLVEAGGVEPLPGIERTEKGKPYFPDRPDLHFSLSRSGSLSLCVLGPAPVGGDIELVRPRSERLPRYVLSDREYTWFAARGSQWEDFYTLWTLKEARVKRTGEGIFRRPAREVAAPLMEPGTRLVWEGARFAALGGEGWRGALCWEDK